MPPAQQLKQCQASWSKFTLIQERFAYQKGHAQGYADGVRDGLMKAIEICRTVGQFNPNIVAVGSEECATSIEMELQNTKWRGIHDD